MPGPPLHAPPDRLHSFGDLTGAKKKTLSLAMLEAADTVLGPLVDEALARGFVVFLWADNGGPVWGKKGTMHESAVNTWLVVVGEGVVPGRSPALIDQVDFAATFSELMGGTFRDPRPALEADRLARSLAARALRPGCGSGRRGQTLALAGSRSPRGAREVARAHA